MSTGTPPRRALPRVWAFVLAAPVVLLMGVSLVNDPGRVGDPSSAADMTLPAFVAIALVLTALLAGVWAFSRVRCRTAVLLAQVVVVWVGGALYVADVRTRVTAWDVAEDAFLLATTLVQLLPGDRSPRDSAPATWWRSWTQDDDRPLWERLRRPLGVLVLAWVVSRNLDSLTSGEALPTFAAAALVAFFAWVALRPLPLPDPRELTADQWRAHSRREMAWWALWTVLAAVVVAWAGVRNGFSPRSLVVVAVPLLPLLATAFGHAKADALVARAAGRS